MSENDVVGRNELFSLDEKPYATYIKTILGQVGINVWDRFTNTPAYTILKGDPRRSDEGSIVDVWSQKEDAYFRRNNARHFEKGVLRVYHRPENAAVEVAIEQFSDEQLKEIVNLRFIALQAKLNKIESVPVLFRMLTIARDLDKSEKITKPIEARISEIQRAEVEKPREQTQEE